MKQIKVIAFDADDTLWENETIFRNTENKFYSLLKDYISDKKLAKILLQIEIKNIPNYGYGVRPFMLSMIETAIKVSNKKVTNEIIEKILALGNAMLTHPVVLLQDVEEVLQKLHKKYKLIVLTKGDLLDQERKLKKSKLEKYFHHVEIVSEKNEDGYRHILHHLDIKAEEFLMVGNSIKSDVLPVLNIGGSAFHIPFHTTWALEKVNTAIKHPKFKELSSISEVLNHVV